MFAGSSCTQTISRASECRVIGCSPTPLRTQFMRNLAGTNQDPFRGRDVPLRYNVEESWLHLIGQVGKGRRGRGISQHAFGHERDQRLAPAPKRLAAQQMKILSCARWLAHLDIVFGCQLQEALDARAGMLGSLPFV